jgi:transcription initiation factor IIF auxiliary subunit
MAIKLDNYARLEGKRAKMDYYRWRVFVDEPPEVLNNIDEVEYTLHPTFPEPNQVRSDPRDKFALETSGWGEFRILAIVRYKDGREERPTYWLDLHKPWPIVHS